jgi:hypothetical protein
MGWLIGVIVIIAIIYFMIDSPGFRYGAIFLVVLVGIAIYVMIENDKKDSQQRRQAEAARDRAALTAISASELALSGVELTKQQSWWILKGNVVNNSKYSLGSIAFLVRIEDCPAQKNCVTVGEEVTRAAVSVPPGQMRSFTSNALAFKGMPIVANPRWHYEIREIRAK